VSTGRARAVANGVHRIRLDSPCGLVANAYVICRGGAVALVDTGFAHTVDQLEAGLAEIGLTLGAVAAVLYTHTHTDHIGGGAALADRWRPSEYVWEGTTPAFGDVYAHIEASREPHDWALRVAGGDAASDHAVAQLLTRPRPPVRAGGPGRLSRPTPVAFGDTVGVGPLRFRCVDARGHDPFHCAWIEEREGWLFSGDVVLAVPTPLVRRMGDDPGRWLGTLRRWSAGDDSLTLFPGHGVPTRMYRASIERSWASFSRVHDTLAASLLRGGVAPMSVTRALLPNDASQFGARTSTLLSMIETLLLLGEEQGWARRDASGWWSDDVPTVDELATD